MCWVVEKHEVISVIFRFRRKMATRPFILLWGRKTSKCANFWCIPGQKRIQKMYVFSVNFSIPFLHLSLVKENLAYKEVVYSVVVRSTPSSVAQVYKNKHMTACKSDVSQDDQFQRPDIVQKVLFVSLAIDKNRVTQFLSFSKDGKLQILVTLLYARVVSSTLKLVISCCL